MGAENQIRKCPAIARTPAAKQYQEKYLNFLTLGSSLPPLEELKTMGIDMTDSKVVESAIKMFENLLNQFEELLEK